MAAGARDLTTLAALKAYLPVTGATEDVLLQDLITRLSAWIEQYLSVDLFINTEVEWRNGTGTAQIMPRELPITAVIAVEVDGVAIPASTGVLVNGFVFSDSIISLRGYRFTRGVQNVKLSYSAGYATLSDVASVPPELQQCAIELCALRYRERPFIGVQSKNLGGETITFTSQDMPKSTATLLDSYKKRPPV